jgi:hypothetical protein
MEPNMSARTTRSQARERIRAIFEATLEQIIPADETKPLKGSRFIDFEDQAEQIARQVLPAVIEERAALDEAAKADSPGCCPACGSARVYLKKEQTQPEIRAPHGIVALPKQHARCRTCGQTFSPSGPRLATDR